LLESFQANQSKFLRVAKANVIASRDFYFSRTETRSPGRN